MEEFFLLKTKLKMKAVSVSTPPAMWYPFSLKTWLAVTRLHGPGQVKQTEKGRKPKVCAEELTPASVSGR